jgi:hypothetical protein
MCHLSDVTGWDLMENAGVDALLADYEAGHSEFQIERFIVDRGNWTIWGRLQQALREIQKRRRGQAQLRDEIQLAQVERIEARRRWCFRETSRRRRAVRLRQLHERIDDLRRSLATNRRELAQFISLARKCARQLGPIDPERRAHLELETWLIRIRTTAAIDVLTRGGLSPSTLELICALPRPDRETLLLEIRQGIDQAREDPHRALLSWLDEFENRSDGAACTSNADTKSASTAAISS